MSEKPNLILLTGHEGEGKPEDNRVNHALMMISAYLTPERLEEAGFSEATDSYQRKLQNNGNGLDSVKDGLLSANSTELTIRPAYFYALTREYYRLLATKRDQNTETADQS